MDLRPLDDYARDHHGLVTRRAAEEQGVSRAVWYRALSSGLIEPVHPGVARLVGSADTRERRIAAAVLGAGPGAVASHRSAAHLWGIPRPDDDEIDVMLPGRSRQTSLDGVVVHRPRDRRDMTPVLRANIRTSNLLRTLCDLGAVDPPAVPAAVDHVVTSGLASPVALRDALDGHARRGRHGVPALRGALDRWVLDGRPTDHVLEPAMHRLLVEHGLPAVEFHAVIGGYEVDFWVVDSPVVLECRGWEAHERGNVSSERDRARDAALAGAGYVTVPFTYRQITCQGPAQAERIRQVIRRWAPHLLGGDRLPATTRMGAGRRSR